MLPPPELLIADIKAVNRGRGVREPLLRPGRELLQALRLDPDCDAETARCAIIAEWRMAADAMPKDLGQVLLIASAISYGKPDITGRVKHAGADVLQVNSRTVWRYYHKAVVQLAQRLVHHTSADGGQEHGFYIVEFSQIADFTASRPVFTARRRIRVTAPQLTEMVDTFGLPGGTEGEPEYRCIDGVELVSVSNPYSRTWSYRLKFSRPLTAGEEVSFAVSVRFPGRDSIDPLAVFVGARHTTLAHLEVWLGSDHERMKVWALPGVPSLAVSDQTPREPFLIPTAAGRVALTFRDLQPGKAYGIRWQWPAT